MSTAVERILGEVLDGLVTCLCAKLAETEKGKPCFCGLVGGQQAIADHCACNAKSECGQAWVRLVSIYAYDTQVTTPARAAACNSPLAAQIELGVYRCIPTMAADGTPPSVVEQTNQVLGQVADAAAMVAAMACCDAVTQRTHVIGTYSPRDSGDCGGGVWPLTVALAQLVPAGQRPPPIRSRVS